MSHLRRRTDRDLHIKWDKLLLYWTNLTKGKPFCGLGTFISCLGAQKSTFWQKGAQKPHFFLRGPSNRTRGGPKNRKWFCFFGFRGGGPKTGKLPKYTPLTGTGRSTNTAWSNTCRQGFPNCKRLALWWLLFSPGTPGKKLALPRLQKEVFQDSWWSRRAFRVWLLPRLSW